MTIPSGVAGEATGLSDRYTIVNAAAETRAVHVNWADGHTSRFHYLWLRDNCPGEQSRAAGTSQRLIDSSEIPADIAPSSVEVRDDEALVVIWKDDGHRSVFEAQWLRDHCCSKLERQRRRPKPFLWDASIKTAPPAADYAELDSDAGRFSWLAMLVDYGFSILRNVPTQTGQVQQVANVIGYVRETNYGRLFDVISIPQPNNLAYTDRGLAVHTDNPYRDPVPGIQLLHCLEAHAAGGETILVDGFRVAEELRTECPAAFETLSTMPRAFRFADQHTDLRCETPLIHTDAFGNVTSIRFNNRSASTLSLPEEAIEPYYEAYRHFAALMYDSRFEYRFKLQPGDLVAMDNERVLHGRTGFDSTAGGRHLQGLYVDRDEVGSRLRVLARTLRLSGGDPGIPGGPRLPGEM